MEYILLIYILITLPFSDPQAMEGVCGVADRKVKAAHEYHGIIHSFQDEDGDYFMRNGQKCNLYTTAFEKWYKEKGVEEKQ